MKKLYIRCTGCGELYHVGYCMVDGTMQLKYLASMIEWVYDHAKDSYCAHSLTSQPELFEFVISADELDTNSHVCASHVVVGDILYTPINGVMRKVVVTKYDKDFPEVFHCTLVGSGEKTRIPDNNLYREV